MPPSPKFRPAQNHMNLGMEFYDAVEAAKFPQKILRFRSQNWAQRVGLGELTDAEWINHFGAFEPLPGSLPKPLALRYHGHQFRSYNPELGDGRGFLFAQIHDLKDGRLLDLGTKGSGQTPWSRRGDGRLTLKGGMREILATEMLEASGVNTSKTFSLIETGESLTRGDEPSPTRSSVLVRLNYSHIRIGTFQRQLHLGNYENISRLMDYAIETYMPETWREDKADRAAAFLENVMQRVASTGAQGMAAGFVHGVLNTDNINITGESFDYGPWRFLPVLDPKFTAAYFDETGLYAFGRQPETLLWNLTRLAECLMPFATQSKLEPALENFGPFFYAQLRANILRRLGVQPQGEDKDALLAQALWSFLGTTHAPFEQTFFDWYGGKISEQRAASSPSRALYLAPAFGPVRNALQDYEPVTGVDLSHAYFQQPDACTILIDEVESLWEPIASRDDWAPLNSKIDAIRARGRATGIAAPT